MRNAIKKTAGEKIIMLLMKFSLNILENDSKGKYNKKLTKTNGMLNAPLTNKEIGTKVPKNLNIFLSKESFFPFKKLIKSKIISVFK
tara:strand:+ start:176 stop:436 length:261 start_codon:yes stop_codon:yes gene_type:complete